MATLQLEVATPERAVYSSPVEMVIFPTELGELGILTGHAPLSSLVIEGEVRITKDGGIERYTMQPGVMTVRQNRVSVLTSGWTVARGSGPADRLVAEDRRSFAETGPPPRPGAGARSEGTKR